MHPRLQLDISWDDLRCALRRSHSEVDDSEALALRVWGGERPSVVGLSVRSLFDAYLSSSSFPVGTPVAFSGVTIEHMVDIARFHGLDVRTIEVDPLTLLPEPGDVESACAAGARMVVITRLFGAWSPLDEIAEVTQRYGAVLVEDAAQAFAGDFHRGEPSADLSLFSFGLIKRATALGGGMAVLRNSRSAEALRQVMHRWPRHDANWFRARVRKAMLLKLLTTPMAFTGAFSLIRTLGKNPDRVLSATARGFPGSDLLKQIRHRPPDALLRFLARRLSQSHDWRHREATQRHLIRAATGTRHAVGMTADRHAAWLVVIRDPHPDALIRALVRSGFDATRAPSRLRAIDTTSRSAEWMRRLVYLPHPVHMTRLEEKRMAQVIAHHRQSGSSVCRLGATDAA